MLTDIKLGDQERNLPNYQVKNLANINCYNGRLLFDASNKIFSLAMLQLLPVLVLFVCLLLPGPIVFTLVFSHIRSGRLWRVEVSNLNS
jgi:hypothetical protein